MTTAVASRNNRVKVKSAGGLAYLREIAGLSARQVAATMSTILGEEKRHLDSIYKLEHRGTKNMYVLEAYAKAINTDLSLVRSVLEAQKRT